MKTRKMDRHFPILEHETKTIDVANNTHHSMGAPPPPPQKKKKKKKKTKKKKKKKYIYIYIY